MNELPEGWVDVRLGDFAKTEKGRKPKLLSTERTEACSIPYVNIKAFEKNVIDEYTDGKGCVICEDDDFLMVWDGSRSGYVGKAITGALGSTLVRIKFPNVNHDYAYFFLQSKFIEINTRAKGVGIPHVDPNLVWNYRFPLPPHPVQHAIVNKIEEIFSELDHGVAQLKVARAQLKVYRQAVLKWAFEGRLTNEGVVDGALPDGWKWVKLGEICKNVEYGSAAKSNENGKVPVLRMGNIQKGRFDWSDLVYTDDEAEISKYTLHKNDVLFNRTNSPELVGKTAIYKASRPAIFAGYLIRINRIEEQIDGDFLNYFMNSMIAKQYGNSVKTDGVNQSNINGQKLKSYPIPLPPLSEQHQIVSEIERRLSVCDKLEETIEAGLKQAEVLRAGVLKMAFEGRLV